MTTLPMNSSGTEYQNLTKPPQLCFTRPKDTEFKMPAGYSQYFNFKNSYCTFHHPISTKITFFSMDSNEHFRTIKTIGDQLLELPVNVGWSLNNALVTQDLKNSFLQTQWVICMECFYL
jgi:hypothetical protein